MIHSMLFLDLLITLNLKLANFHFIHKTTTHLTFDFLKSFRLLSFSCKPKVYFLILQPLQHNFKTINVLQITAILVRNSTLLLLSTHALFI